MHTDDWPLRAACRGLDAELFFSTEVADMRRALQVCSTCPVRGQCLQVAMDAREAFGVWGGTPEKVRRRVFRREQRGRRGQADAA